MKDCFGRVVSSLDKIRECRICSEAEACSQICWDGLVGEGPTAGVAVDRDQRPEVEAETGLEWSAASAERRGAR